MELRKRDRTVEKLKTLFISEVSGPIYIRKILKNLQKMGNFHNITKHGTANALLQKFIYIICNFYLVKRLILNYFPYQT